MRGVNRKNTWKMQLPIITSGPGHTINSHGHIYTQDFKGSLRFALKSWCIKCDAFVRISLGPAWKKSFWLSSQASLGRLFFIVFAGSVGMTAYMSFCPSSRALLVSRVFTLDPETSKRKLRQVLKCLSAGLRAPSWALF